MEPKERFLNALHQTPTDRQSVGNCVSAATIPLMEASGCRFPEAHIEPETMACLAATSVEILGYDTIAPVFSVQHEAAALGCEVDWGRMDKMPVNTTSPWNTVDDVVIPADFLNHPACSVVLEALSLLKTRYSHTAIIGKVFGPWTLAYHLFGVEKFLIMTLDTPDDVRHILEALTPVAAEFAAAQLAAGADAVTLADHATGDLVSARMYEEMLWPLHCELAKTIEGPVILHICGNTADRLDAIARTGLRCFHFESKVPAAEARRIAGDRISLMGNINNPELLLFGTPEKVAQTAREVSRAGIEIIAPECAVPLTTPTANLQALVIE